VQALSKVRPETLAWHRGPAGAGGRRL
jgi:hypothetical protein